ncbi:MAG: hypothetical protein R3C26_05590 [Calditrichia bacterium]
MKRSCGGANDNDLITKIKVDPIMGGTGMRGNFVTFERATQQVADTEGVA